MWGLCSERGFSLRSENKFMLRCAPYSSGIWERRATVGILSMYMAVCGVFVMAGISCGLLLRVCAPLLLSRSFCADALTSPVGSPQGLSVRKVL